MSWIFFLGKYKFCQGDNINDHKSLRDSFWEVSNCVRNVNLMNFILYLYDLQIFSPNL